MITPVRYNPSFEVLEEEEAKTEQGFIDTLLGISKTTYADSGHAIRSVHAKSHALLRAELTVLDHVAPEYAQGLFAKAGTYPVIMRLSTSPGDILDDKISTPRGMALKIIGVEGARVDGSEGDVTQDFIMVNGPVFTAPTGKKFLVNLKLLAGTTDKAPGLKLALSAALRGTEKLIEAVGGESATLKAMGGHPETNPLGETYFSQVPVLFGDYMAKISLAPVSPELTVLTDAPVDLKGTPDGLRKAMQQHFASQGGTWELRVQLCTDLEKMPIEDPTVEWKQEESPYVAVARLVVQPQEGWSEELSKKIDDGIQFSPWHAIAAHRPLGSIMRIRKVAYQASQKFRTEKNGVPLVEPKDIAGF